MTDENSLPDYPSDSEIPTGDQPADLSDALLSPSARSLIQSQLSAQVIPEQIGPYKILKILGEGGMGVVYLAEQSKPIKRRVAIKVIKLGMDTNQVIARFEAERQALAMMDHANVASVFDAGAAEDGRPYFVMEHVPGVPITEHCDLQKLNINERVKLFIQICDAVQHAHQKGIIHRDLKPSNILVAVRDGHAVLKVIDFGVAKATSQKLTERTLFTEQGQLVGTPEYMSPEQAEMSAQDIDTRSDIYSAGVLLYELLSGSRPFDSKKLRLAGLAEIQRIIREQDPPKPSTKLSSLISSVKDSNTAKRIAEVRHTDLRALTGVLRHDLDWIVMKCIEKNRERRYETANALAMDLQRFLNNEPVLAGPPSAAYRMSKFVKRNRGGVIAASLIACAVFVGFIGTAYGFIEANNQRIIANQRADESEKAMQETKAARAEEAKRTEELQQVADFQSQQLGKINPQFMGSLLRQSLIDAVSNDQQEIIEQSLVGINFTNIALETLEENIFKNTITAINEQFADQPVVQAQLLHTTANILRELGLLSLATDPQKKALAIRRSELGDSHIDTLNSVSNMGVLLGMKGNLAEAEPYYSETLEGLRSTLGNDHPNTLSAINNMALLLKAQGKLTEAEPFYLEALKGFRREYGDDHPETLISINNMAGLLRSQGKLEEAVPYIRESLEGRRRTLGNGHPNTLNSINNMGMLLEALGKSGDAEPYYREALAGRRQTLGDDHPSTLVSINNMGFLLRKLGQLEEAEILGAEVVKRCRDVLPPGHRYLAQFLAQYARTLTKMLRFADSEKCLLEAYNIYKAASDISPKQIASVNQQLIDLYDSWHEAEPEKGYDTKAAEWRDKFTVRGEDE